MRIKRVVGASRTGAVRFLVAKSGRCHEAVLFDWMTVGCWTQGLIDLRETHGLRDTVFGDALRRITRRGVFSSAIGCGLVDRRIHGQGC